MVAAFVEKITAAFPGAEYDKSTLQRGRKMLI